MAWSRRGFLGLMFGAGAGALAQAAEVPRELMGARPESFLFREKPKQGFSILQGMTDETSAQFSLLLPRQSEWKIEIADPGAEGATPAVSPVTVSMRDFSDFAVHKLKVEGLRLGRDYTLRVREVPTGAIKDERTFGALDLSRRAVKLGFLSCACDHLHRDDIWERLESERPEMVFFLGDNVYGDLPRLITVRRADPRQLWERYVQTRNRVAFYFQKRLTPVLAIWDDHDFGGNNLSRENPYKDDARLIFETFFAQEDRAALIHGPGIARRFSAFGADFFLLDGRTYRDAGGQADSRMFGSTLEKWLFPNVQAKPTWLLNGSVFYGAYTGKDSFEGNYANDFARFIARLRETEGLFCFGSGDVHFSELMDIEKEQLGYPTFEMISSSVHSFTFPGHEWRWHNARRRTATSAHNFSIFEGEFAEDGLNGSITSYSSRAVEYRKDVSVRRS